MLPRRHRTVLIASAATAAVVGAGVLATISAYAATGCRVDYAITNQWQGGFGANVTITNLGDPINGWSLTWTYTAGQTVTQVWNATVTQSGGQVTATNVDYNADARHQRQHRVRLQRLVDLAATRSRPSFALNGTTCTGGVAPDDGDHRHHAPPTTPPVTTPPVTTTTTTSQPPNPAALPPTPPASNAKWMERLNRGLISVRSGIGQPGLLAAARHRPGQRRLQRLPRLDEGERDTDHRLDQLPRRRRGRRRRRTRCVPVVDGTEQRRVRAARCSSPTATSTCRSRCRRAAPRRAARRTRTRPTTPASATSTATASYEIVLKWDPSNAKDNSQSGYTGNVYRRRVPAQRHPAVAHRPGPQHPGRRALHPVPGVRLRRRRPGRGRHEDRRRHPLRHRAGHRQRRPPTTATRSGYILTGPEFLTMFNGLTGAVAVHRELRARRAAPSRPGATATATGSTGSSPAPPTSTAAGPSLIMARGYYTRAVIAAWDFRNGALTRRWTFDSGNSGGSRTRPGQPPAVRRPTSTPTAATRSSTARRRSTTTARALWNTGLGHGDALHVGDLDPEPRRPGGVQGPRVDAASPAPDSPTRAPARSSGPAPPTAAATTAAASPRDIYAGSAGRRVLVVRPEHDQPAQRHRRLASGRNPSLGQLPGLVGRRPGARAARPDPHRQVRHRRRHPAADRSRRARPTTAPRPPRRCPATSSATGARRSSGAPATARALRIYTTPNHDRPRGSSPCCTTRSTGWRIAWQNTAYNQPPHPSFFIGNGMATPPAPNVRTP